MHVGEHVEGILFNRIIQGKVCDQDMHSVQLELDNGVKIWIDKQNIFIKCEVQS